MDDEWDPEAIITAELAVIDKKIEEAKSKENEVVQLEDDHGLRKANREQLEDRETELLPPGAVIRDVPLDEELDGDNVEADNSRSSNMTIHTICFEPEFDEDEPDDPNKVPIVMLHGLGGSSVEFRKNYSKLSKDRTVYGIDIPGFGLSSRDTNYCSDNCTEYSIDMVQKCEEKLVDLLDTWREKNEIEKMVIVGHSFGGYVAMVYALKHENRVEQLVLIEPWGILNKDQSFDLKKKNPKYKHNSIHIRLAMAISRGFDLKPLTLLRGIGYGIGALVFGVLVPSTHKDAYGSDGNLYFIGLNTLHDPSGSGEDLFRLLSGGTYVYPVISFQSRVQEVSTYPPMSIIYGKNHKISGKDISFIQEGEALKSTMLQMGLQNVEVVEAPTSSHHAHAENPKWFHRHMNRLLEKIDNPSA